MKNPWLKNRDLSPIARQGHWMPCTVSYLTVKHEICSLNVHCYHQAPTVNQRLLLQLL